MIVQGVDLDTIGPMTAEYHYPAIVPGRAVHIDGDFIAYEVSYDDDIPPEVMRKNCAKRLEHIRKASGAEKMQVHLTASGSTKGGRYDQARLKEYQATRKRDKPVELENMRKYMRDVHNALYWTDREADDGMAQANYNAIKFKNPGMSVIASRDKDLRMVPGLHFDFESGIVEEYSAIGGLYLIEKAKSKKLTGTGWMFFLAQMLMGDQADNISGLPAIYGHSDYKDGTKCGPVATFNILHGSNRSFKDSLRLVINLYKAYGEKKGFVNWRDGKPITWAEAFMSEAQLLWMRRSTNPLDVRVWMQEVLSAA